MKWTIQKYYPNILMSLSFKTFTIPILLLTLCHSMTFTEFKLGMQEKAMKISSKLEQYYKQWCINGQATCQTKSTNACKGVQESKCDMLFPKPAVCFNGGYRTSNVSSIKFPSDINYDQLGQEQIKFICATAKLETIFKQIINERENKIPAMYIGSNRGLFREFPGNYHGNEQDQCDDYDPRYRPWYTIAASGAKNVIILLDKSSSMNEAGKIELAKSAVLSVIDSLSISDNVGVIAFENSTEDIGGSHLMKMTNDNKQTLQESVKNVKSYQGQTNFKRAFQRGLEMVVQGITSGISGCSQAQNVFLLITDGKPTQDAITAESLVSLIKQKINGYKQIKRQIIVFAYALGEVINTEFLKILTCSFRGIVIVQSNISINQKSSSAFATKLREFYIYLSVGVKFTSPVWTQPYYDYYGYGLMVTVSMPAYYIDQKTNLSKMIGVTGVDIIMSQFEKFGFSQQEVITQLIGESACQKNEITDCQLQALRSPSYQCISSCRISQNTDNSCQIVPKTAEIFKKIELFKDSNKCCGLTVIQFIITMVFSIFGLILFIVVFLCRKRIHKKFCDRSYKKISEKSPNDSNKERKKSASKQCLTTQNLSQQGKEKEKYEIESASNLRKFST